MREWPEDELEAGADALGVAGAWDSPPDVRRAAVVAILDAVHEARMRRIDAGIDSRRAERRRVLIAHGIDGLTTDPETGKVVPCKLRNHICVLDGVEIDGHRVYDGDGPCAYCGADLPGPD